MSALTRIVARRCAQQPVETPTARHDGWRAACYADAQAFLAEDTDERGCLILDVRMPGMTGLELQKRMLACGIDLPVIFVTGHGDVDMAVYTM